MSTETHKPWHAINPGGSPAMVWDGERWYIPTFATHDECRSWWNRHERRTGQSAWAITDTAKEAAK